MLCEQRPALGGAIIASRPKAGPRSVLPSLRGRWQALSGSFRLGRGCSDPAGAFRHPNSTGAVLIEDRAAGKVEVCRPRALILGCGPWSGKTASGLAFDWRFAAAGGLQVMLKEGRVPEGRILLAGSGPLLLALAAQMTAAASAGGVIEEGDPASRPLAAVRLLAHPPSLRTWAALMGLSCSAASCGARHASD